MLNLERRATNQDERFQEVDRYFRKHEAQLEALDSRARFLEARVVEHQGLIAGQKGTIDKMTNDAERRRRLKGKSRKTNEKLSICFYAVLFIGALGGGCIWWAFRVDRFYPYI